jgi:hypothetical protein
MMNKKEIEIAFVNTFVLKIKRERSIFELNSMKKRRDFFSKLCHTYNQIIDSRFMTKIDTPNSNPKGILQMLINEGAGVDCYLLSYFDNLDRRRMPLSEALDKCVGIGMPSIVICNPEKLAYFEAEQEAGSPPRYLLKMK